MLGLAPRSDIWSALIYGKVESVTSEEAALIECGYIWFDWCLTQLFSRWLMDLATVPIDCDSSCDQINLHLRFSIPQITVRRPGDNPDMGSDVKQSVDSIPAYVEASQVFMALCPDVEHHSSFQMCNLATWARRGWCRVECAAAAYGKLRKRMVVIRSSSVAFLMSPITYLFDTPGDGDFTVDTDRIQVYQIMEEIVDRHIEALWCQGEVTCARLFSARRRALLARLGTETDQEASRMMVAEPMSEFLQRFRFTCPTEQTADGLGPITCAAIAGNISVLRELVASKADMRARNRKNTPSIFMCKGDTVFMNACMHGGDPEVLAALLELRADPRPQGVAPPLVYAGDAGNVAAVEYLLDSGLADIEDVDSFGNTPVTNIPGCGSAECTLALLKRGANVNPPPGILGWSPLVMAIWDGSVECCRLLIEHRADVNRRIRGAGLTGAMMYRTFRLMRPFVSDGSPIKCLTLIEGATPLSAASFFGHSDIINLLLSARADPDVQARSGLRAADFARLGRHDTAAFRVTFSKSALGESAFAETDGLSI